MNLYLIKYWHNGNIFHTVAEAVNKKKATMKFKKDNKGLLLHTVDRVKKHD